MVMIRTGYTTDKKHRAKGERIQPSFFTQALAHMALKKEKEVVQLSDIVPKTPENLQYRNPCQMRVLGLKSYRSKK